jgi:hypothetical protein
MVVGVAEAVAGGGLAAGVSDAVVKGQCFKAVTDGLGVVAQVGLVPADRVAGAGLARRVPGGPEQIKGLLGVVEYQGVLILVLPQPGEGKMGTALADTVAELPVEINSMPEMAAGIRIDPQFGLCTAQASVRAGLGGPVTCPLRGGYRETLRCRPVVPVPPAVKIVSQAPADLADMVVKSGRCGVRDGCQQHCVLGFEPGQRLGAVMKFQWHDLARGLSEGQHVPGWVEQQCRLMSGAHVIVQHPAHGGVPVGVAVAGPSFLDRVGPQKIVKGEPGRLLAPHRPRSPRARLRSAGRLARSAASRPAPVGARRGRSAGAAGRRRRRRR